ncbi:DUF2490 domain-containing protein [Pelagicoccus sp. SDUM812003]|uniref:DUF2490 domain-containing protein n=1 Tax=Pelagicoccus sp. SDUM812003 TaxID=3041267 RepID=UPI00280E2AFA|nr:DUF2490 domain-containing protein [Pelagicoccus sp. SDUM812003]MDQ8203113.1 DUF2490 domain-containing protein [Pelagicoccus sp. SDUM812003]
MVSKISRLALVAIGCFGGLLSHASEGTAVWLSASAPSYELTDKTKTKTAVELRLPDASELTYYRIGQQFYTSLNSDWQLGSHLSFENSKKASDWNHTIRLELELNPSKISLGQNGPDLSMRNRWELRWKEDKGSEIFHRLRHRSKVTWKLENGPFSSFSIGDEIFFEEDKGKITMNRFYPAILTAKHGDGIKGTYYLMYQSKRAGTSSDWNGEYVLGIGYSF